MSFPRPNQGAAANRRPVPHAGSDGSDNLSVPKAFGVAADLACRGTAVSVLGS